MASVIFKIIVALLSKVGWVRFPHSPATALTLLILCVPMARIQAQQRDTARAGIAPPPRTNPVVAPVDTTPKPPMSPRRAFLTSLVLPGYAQTIFGRDRAAMLFTIIEVGAIGMARKSAQDLAEAKGLAHDSVVGSYRIDPNTGRAIIDPKTGQPIPETYIASRFTPDRIKARRTHYEDWIAAIVFNHLFSGADAYVAANLWDFRTNVGVASGAAGERRATVSASLSFR